MQPCLTGCPHARRAVVPQADSHGTIFSSFSYLSTSFPGTFPGKDEITGTFPGNDEVVVTFDVFAKLLSGELR